MLNTGWADKKHQLVGFKYRDIIPSLKYPNPYWVLVLDGLVEFFYIFGILDSPKS